jgi:peptidoglycan/LPS O-acetylase OafA/YrhL
MPKKAKRLPELDVLRATAILFLQFYFIGYTFVNTQNTDPYYFYWLGQFGLALFFFVSGFAIDLNNRDIRTREDAGKFFKKRAKRIYPLYWLALGVVVLAPALYRMAISGTLTIPNPGAIALAVTYVVGAQELFSLVINGYVYLWFVSAILILYAIYPVIARYSADKAIGRNIKNLLAVSTIIFGIFLAVNYVFSIMEYRFFLYYYIFMSGIVVNRTNIFNTKVNSRRLTVVFLAIFAVTVAYQILFAPHVYDPQFESLAGITARWLIYIPIDLLLIFAIFHLARNYYNVLDSRIQAAISYVAYASYPMYLFFALFLGGTAIFLEHYDASKFLILAAQIFVGLPISIVISFNLQRLADRIIPRSKPKNNEKSSSQI